MRFLKIVCAMVLITGFAVAQHAVSVVKSDPNFEKLKNLVGEWEGKEFENGKEYPSRTDFRVVSGGSVLMNRLQPGTPDEMITMFHMDGDELLATHYCSAHNQPRMRAVPSKNPKVVNFAFKDATNVAGPQVGRMDQVKFTIVDANHHVQEWTFRENGKLETGRFEFTRKK